MRSNGGFSGAKKTVSVNAASGIWSIRDAQREQGASNWPISSPPVSGFIGYYTANSFSGTTWTDLSGNGYNAPVSKGTVISVSTTGNGASKTFNTLQGGTGDGIRFPVGILPSIFTLFHVTRYTGTNARILNGINTNWLDGFWGGASGVAFHEGWLTDQTNRHGQNWVLSTSQNSLYRSQKVTRGSSGGSGSDRLSVNDGFHAEYSSWQCAEIIVYNGIMSAPNYGLVEDYLNAKYGLGL